MKILLLASKPKPAVPIENDNVVFVNGSIYYSKEFTCNIYHVFGDSIFYWNSDLALITKENLKNKHVIKSWVIKYRNVDIVKLLNEVNYKYDEVEYLRYDEKENLTWEILGKSFINNVLWCKGFALREKSKYIFYDLFRRKIIKLSTGLFALLLLRQRFPEAEICVSGIGFGNDVYAWHKGTNRRRGHLINDYCGFMTLKQKGMLNNVITTEFELHKLFDIPMYKGPTKIL